MTHTDPPAVANEAQAWFDGYVETFIELAAKEAPIPRRSSTTSPCRSA
ncbi:hypothetical protein JK359_31770 [Streptomyces actinomycinicus]|uniref:Uncharacterized protein n=1 Tax=Streptomyces actinomycinicus TaxID=1695166 RepID=A0A937EQE3_9ACTN|nr:hypothetical protein [Streptomyces actinomycinicus]MBL1086490.1 hypothetical protein [Streptomyces actinomycinicus]